MVDEEVNMIEEAKKIAERIEEANKIQAEQIKKLEAIEARNILGGKTSISPPTIELSEEEKVKEKNKSIFKNTVLEGVFK